MRPKSRGVKQFQVPPLPLQKNPCWNKYAAVIVSMHIDRVYYLMYLVSYKAATCSILMKPMLMLTTNQYDTSVITCELQCIATLHGD